VIVSTNWSKRSTSAINAWPRKHFSMLMFTSLVASKFAFQLIVGYFLYFRNNMADRAVF